jgi:DMSO reductase anchor subunit
VTPPTARASSPINVAGFFYFNRCHKRNHNQNHTTKTTTTTTTTKTTTTTTNANLIIFRFISFAIAQLALRFAQRIDFCRIDLLLVVLIFIFVVAIGRFVFLVADMLHDQL